VRRGVTEMLQELDCPGRDPRISQELHASRAQWVQFVLGQRSNVDEGLAHILFVEVR
jgi:hypothetical protein